MRNPGLEWGGGREGNRMIKAAVDSVFLHHLETAERGSAGVMEDGTPLTGHVCVNLRNVGR